MSILLFFEKKRPKAWLETLRSELPQTKIEVYPNVENPDDIEFIIAFRPKKEEFEQFPNVKVVQSFGAGINYILEANVLTEQMTLARMVDPYLQEDMFEFVLNAILIHLKNIPAYIEQQRQEIWKPHFYRRISETTIAILGLGQVGGYVAQKLSRLGFKVKGWSNSKKNISGVESFVGQEGLKNCLNGTDILINILPLTPETHQILNQTNLQHLPKGAFLINVGRGGHNHEQGIIDLLDSNHLSGALLDVFDQEPLSQSHPFWKHPKVIITPHIGSLTNPISASKLIAENYRRFKSGQTLKNVVDLKKGY